MFRLLMIKLHPTPIYIFRAVGLRIPLSPILAFSDMQVDQALVLERPLQVIKASEAGNLLLCHDNIEVLRKRCGSASPTKVASFVGPLRIGKSTTATMLAAFLDRRVANKVMENPQLRFAVSNESETMTKGIYAWPVEMADGSTAVILDVEGLDAPDQVYGDMVVPNLRLREKLA